MTGSPIARRLAKARLSRGPLLGAHLSIEGGYHRAVERGNALGCTAVQIFTKNQVRWSAKSLGSADVRRFRETFRQSGRRTGSGVRLVLAHGSYLYNFASPSRGLLERSVNGLLDELERCDRLGISRLVVHPGAHLGEGEERGIRSVTETLATVLRRYGGGAVVCLETTAGQGTGIGYRFEHIGAVIRDLKDRRVGACLDTCHVFAAGYDIRTPAGCRRTVDEFERKVGLDRLKVIHLNDSKGALGSRIDRHMHIGKGAIGEQGFRFFMRDERFAGVPKIIETPKKLKNREMDRVNLALLARLASGRGRAEAALRAGQR